MKDQDNELDTCGQQPNLGIYTQLCLCYPLSDESIHQRIVDRLNSGLIRLAEGFPWVAAQVVNEGANESSAGVFKFRPLEGTPRLIVQDLRSTSPEITWTSLKDDQFPFRSLDEGIICPRKTIPDGTEGPEKPVFLVQANFITGGLLLTFTASHQALDMTGQGRVMHLLDKACRGEAFTADELLSGNPKRSSLIAFLDGTLPDNPFQDVKDPVPPSPPAKCSWAYISFSASALAELKSEATAVLTSGFVSTDDVLTAFIWKSIARARSSRLGDHIETTLGRAVDPRRFLDIPETYPGIIQNMVYHKRAIGELAAEPLGKTAKELRVAVDPSTSTLSYDTRVLMTKLHRSPLKDTVTVSATFNGSKDIMLSSWAKEKSYALEFGLGLGTPVAVRRPQFVPYEGLLYLMPKRLDGEILLAACLREEDLETLKTDDWFLRFGVPVL
ncbi:transferase family-domain-containing protein [Dendryphion nanum]|uniref:Transferase family-domain-containing protein n=1 Tax=Dendryphion nanum TaxID=256645 RepID=A0A9P9D1C9_9PLEO|nr:transferase family-domain-containing protein [Dendryphion nanum]